MNWNNWILQKNIDFTLDKLGVSRQEYLQRLIKADGVLSDDDFHDYHKAIINTPRADHPYFSANDEGKKKILSDMRDYHRTYNNGDKFTQGKDLSKPDNSAFSDLHQDTQGKRPQADHPFFGADEQSRKNIWDAHVNKLNNILDWEKQNPNIGYSYHAYHDNKKEDEEQKAQKDAHDQAERAKWVKNRPWMKR